MSLDDDESKAAKGVGCFFCLLVVVALTVPWAFVYVEYDEMAFKKNSFNNEVDTSAVYREGRYFWGWQGSAIRFPSTFQFVDFSGSEYLSCFTSDGLDVHVEASFQYKLIESELQQMFARFSLNYESQIKNVGKSAIKNAIIQFKLEDLIQNRRTVSRKIYQQLATDLSNIHASVPTSKFQLRKMKLPSRIIDKYIGNSVLIQETKRDAFQNIADLIRANTTVQKFTIDAQSRRVLEQAKAEAELIKNRAAYEARAMVAEAEGKGYAKLFQTIGITNNPVLQQKFLRLDALLESDVKPQLLFGLQTANVMLGTN